VGVLLSVLVASVPVSEAALDGCRSDPVIYLSDGSAIDLSANIGTSVTNVKAISYTVHVPAGLKMILYAATPTLGFRGKESFALVNDSPAGHYSTDTLVQTSNRGVSATSQTTLVGVYVSGLKVSLQSKPASGYAGQHLWTTISR
jgi:hypothetical protein